MKIQFWPQSGEGTMKKSRTQRRNMSAKQLDQKAAVSPMKMDRDTLRPYLYTRDAHQVRNLHTNKVRQKRKAPVSERHKSEVQHLRSETAARQGTQEEETIYTRGSMRGG